MSDIEDNNNSLTEIVNHLDNLETRFKELFDSLKKGELPIEEKLTRVVTISESVRISVIKPLKVGKKDLIKYYNECPALLTEYASEVDLIPDSYRGNISEIIVERSPYGKFWVILTENPTDQSKFYWLLPNGNQSSFRNFTNETITKLFEIESPNHATEEISLLDPARLSICPNNIQWKLENRGVIKKGSLPIQSITSFELEKVSNFQQDLKVQIAEFNKQTELISKLDSFNNSLTNYQERLDKLEKLPLQIIELNQNTQEYNCTLDKVNNSLITYQDRLNKLEQISQNSPVPSRISQGINPNLDIINNSLATNQGKINKLELQLQQISQNLNQYALLSNKIETILQQQRELKAELELLKPSKKYKSELEIFIETYNHNPENLSESLKEKLIIVSETKESIRQRFIGNSNKLIFHINKDGVYWLFQSESNYYLVLYDPNHLDITGVAIEKTLKLLFECRNYQSSAHKKPPILIKPAQVISINNNPQQWELQELGILEFI